MADVHLESICDRCGYSHNCPYYNTDPSTTYACTHHFDVDLASDMEKSINALYEMADKFGVPRSVYVIEECSELIKELTKERRGKGSEKDIIAEACDVLTTIYVLLMHYDVPRSIVEREIMYKCNRALERYRKNQEV